MIVGSRVQHKVYGLGTVTHVVSEPSRVDRKINSMTPIQNENLKEPGNWHRHSNGRSRNGRNSSLNVAVKFDNGGPVGFALSATHDVRSLKKVD